MQFENFLVGRQPILDRNEDIFGYEFLFRKTSKDETAVFLDSVTATSRVLMNIFQNFDLRSLTGNKYAFVNIDEDIVDQDVLDVLPKDKLVLEIVETTNVTKPFVEKIAQYHRDGYRFALDDFVLSKQYFAMFMPLFPYVEFLKVDMHENCIPKIEKVEKIFQGRHMMLLAEKVETREDFQFCMDGGFELFQGFFFDKPEIIKGKNIEPSKSAILRILSLLSSRADIDEIEMEFRLQPELSLKLLKLLNTCSYCLRHEITSIRHALMLIGRETMRKWLTMLLYAGSGGEGVRSALLETALLKAHTLELITIKVYGEKYSRRADAFFIGLLSFLDVILKISKEDLLDSVMASELIREAILKREGEIGSLLAIMDSADDSENDFVKSYLEKFKLTEEDITLIKFEGLEWLADQQAIYDNV